MTDISATEISRMNYEDDIHIKNYRAALDAINRAYQLPVLDNVKLAFACVNTFAKGLIYKKTLDQYKKNIKPELDNVEIVLYGDMDDASANQLRAVYHVRLEKQRDGSVVIVNAQNIIKSLDSVAFVVKQLSYDEGFFAKKPWERTTGVKAIEASAAQ
jgi:hypothetical protein